MLKQGDLHIQYVMGKILFTLLVLGFWTAGSAYHYVCNIKDVCVQHVEVKPVEIVKAEIVPVVSSVKAQTWTAFFALGSSRKIVDSDTTAIASELAELISQNPNGKIMLHGYADHSGHSTFNDTLSKRRVKTIQAILLAKGIASEKIEMNSHGDNFSEDLENGRRVEILFNPTM